MARMGQSDSSQFRNASPDKSGALLSCEMFSNLDPVYFGFPAMRVTRGMLEALSVTLEDVQGMFQTALYFALHV